MTTEPDIPDSPLPSEPVRKQRGKTNRVGWDRWAELAFALAIVVLTVGNCWTSYSQWQAMRETNQIATRPYLKFKLIPEAFRLRIAGAAASDFAGIKFKIENSGKLPARVYVQSSANWSGAGHPADDQHWDSFGVSARGFIFPGDDGPEFSSYLIGVSQGQRTDMATGDAYFVVLDALYGPSSINGMPSNEFRTKICVRYQVKRGTDTITLGDGEPCPSQDSNSAK